ncbi:hypothetical protein NKH77_38875 [Streptomyces sp. M19]
MELTCDCGRTGHLAAYASGPGIRRMAEELRARDARGWRRSLLGGPVDRGVPFETAFASALDAGTGWRTNC